MYIHKPSFQMKFKYLVKMLNYQGHRENSVGSFYTILHYPGLQAVMLPTRGLHGSKNSKRPINMLHGTDPDPYFIWKWDPNPCRPEKCLKCTTRTRRGPDHYSKVGPEPGWEDTDPTAPVPIGTYCTANAIMSINKLRKKKLFALTTVSSPLPDCVAYNPLCQ